MTYYSVSSSGRLIVPVAGSGLPIIKMSSGTSGMDLVKFTQSLNSYLGKSPTYRAKLMLRASEGIVVSAVKWSSGGWDPRVKNDPRGFAAVAIYPEGPDRKFKDDSSKSFEIEAVLSLDYIKMADGSYNYNMAVAALPHEVMGHPEFGYHGWVDYPRSHSEILNDNVYRIDIDIDTEVGRFTKNTNKKISSYGENTTFMSVSGFKAMLVESQGWTQADINNPDNAFMFDGQYALSNGVVVLTDDQYRTVRAEAYRQSVEDAFKSGVDTKSKKFEPQDFSSEEAKYLKYLQRKELGSQIGDVIGSSLGTFLSKGGAVKGIVYSSLLGEIGERLGAAIMTKNLETAISEATFGGLGAFGEQVAVRAGQAAVGSISSWLSMELGEALGLEGFGAELFETVGSQVTTVAINNLLNQSPIFQGFITKVTGGAKQSVSGGGMAGAVGAFLGAKLGAMVVNPQTQAGVALSSIGSAVGVFLARKIIGDAAGIALNFLAPGLGSFVGFVLGALVGNLFGRKKPKIPSASAETVLQIPYARYELGAVTVVNNGDRSLVTAMATMARDTLNGLIAAVAYTNTTSYVGNLNGVGTTQIYGHTAGQIYVKINSVQNNFASADKAVEFGALTAIRNTKIVGGDIFSKRVIAKSPAADLISLTGDLQIASDYRFYANNRDLVNSFITKAYANLSQWEKDFYDHPPHKALIDKLHTKGASALTADETNFYNSYKSSIDKIIGALENQSLANPWIITLQRVSELGLDKFATSDFYGGLRGFLDSFDLKGHGTAYENIRITAQGNGAEIQSRRQTSDGLFSILPQSKAGPGDNDILNARFESGMQGWDMATWQVANPQRGVNINADWSGSGNDVFWTHMPGTPAAGSVIDVRSALMVSAAGVTYEMSVKAANHRGVTQMYVEFYDANMNQVGGAFMNGQGLEGGSWHGDLANYNTISGTATAPPGTAYRRMVLRLVSTGGEAPFGFFTQPTSRAVDQRVASWTDQGEVLRIEDLSQVGYTVTTPGATTAGNDLVDQRLNVGGVLIDDRHTEIQYEWSWMNPATGMMEILDEPIITEITVEGGDDIFVGGEGGDHLYGRNGWDWLDGRGGNDYLDGGDGNDTLLGGAGEDALLGGAGDDYLAGGDGTDSLDGGAGNDVLADSWGSEVLQGGNGDDTFLIAEDGTFNWFWGGYADPNSDPNGKDTISAERLGFGVAFDIDYRPPEWNGNPDATAGNPISRMAVITNAVTGAWVTNEGLLSIENATGSEFGDRIYGTAGDNVLKGLGGADQLWGRDGNDTIEGGAGADSMAGEGGFDWLSYVGSSAGVYVDLSTGEAYGGDAEGDVFSGFEAVRGSKAADQLKGYDGGDNWLDGDAGDDWLVATTGNDVFVGGEGKDFVDYSAATGAVALNLGGYTATGVINGYGYGGMAAGQTYIGVEGVVGTNFADSIIAGDGDQTIVGGKGNDTLQGGAGADTYVISRGDGYDTVTEDNGGWNVLSFEGGVKFSDLWTGTVGGTGGYLDVGIRGDNAQFRVAGNFANLNSSKIKTLDLGGAGLDVEGIEYAPMATDNTETIYGWTDRRDLIVAYNGDDLIYGAGAGQAENKGNVVIAGLGNDVIVTSGGDDQFAYDRGDGLDSIHDSGGEDTLVFGPTIAAEDVIYEVLGDHLYIGARNLADPNQTAYFTPDHVQIWNGGIKYIVKDGWTGQVMYESLNTVEYVLAGGTSIDLRKLDIKWTESVSENYNYAYPIALDLDGDGLSLAAVDSSEVVVRTAGGGVSRIGWVGPADGFLAVDRDGDGAINKLSELSFVQDKPGATSDLEGLRTWDTNGDGLLDKSDRDFSKILLFVDANQNGRSTASELRTLEQAGIAAINLGGLATGVTREMTTESFVQHTISFVWADGRTGEGYDVALARRVLGSVGYDAGEYQSEWGSADEDGELGRLLNDPVAAAKAARIREKKGLLDKLGATYAEIKAAAQLDFSDHDRVDASIARRWAKMSASEQASWLTGQQTSGKVRLISSEQAHANGLNAAAKARQDVVDQGYAQARAAVARGSLGSGATGEASPGGVAGLGVGFGATGLGLSLAGGEPLETGPAYGGASGRADAWWRQDEGSGLLGGGSLGARLAAMAAEPGRGSGRIAAEAVDGELLQRQALLRQAMAGFGGQAGGGAAVWSREADGLAVPLAASAGLKAQPVLTA